MHQDPENSKMLEEISLGAGCFWGVEHLFKKLKGVTKTTCGYMNGDTINPTYREVCSGSTNHAEVVHLEFDPKIISLESILDYFFRLHDPTTLNRQHGDIGTQYRSAIYFYNDIQQETSLNFINKLDSQSVFKSKIVTQVEQAQTFYAAEDYHQDYLAKNPTGYMCHILRK